MDAGRGDPTTGAKHAIGEIKNFVEIGDLIATGGQPSESQLNDLASAGYRVVINLGLLDPK